MVKVKFKLNGETKIEMWDCEGMTWKKVREQIEGAVKSIYPDATDIVIIEALTGVGKI